MNSTKLQIQKIGQIKEAEMVFGDLTILIGPQATGKSISLQLLKLITDVGQITEQLKKYGLDWDGKLDKFLDIYLGEGMSRIWRENESLLKRDGETVDLPKFISRRRKTSEEEMFYIPAQRVLTLRDGWPRPFTDYSPGDPFAVRDFSEKLRLLLEQEFNASEGLFPQKKRLKDSVRKMLSEAFFPGYELRVDKYRSQRRLVLQENENKNSNKNENQTHPEQLPFMVWSAGQREFVPLLLGLYWLMPPTKTAKRKGINWVVIEEPEMGLHPHAISVTMLMILELLWRGYKVCVSTHSPHVLDIVWAIQVIKSSNADPRLLLKLFDNNHALTKLQPVADSLMNKDFRVYYFGRDGKTQDISYLDPGSENLNEAGWGGISEFSGRVADVVSEAIAQKG